MEQYIKGKQGRYEGILNKRIPLENYINSRKELKEKFNISTQLDNKKPSDKELEVIAKEVEKVVCQIIKVDVVQMKQNRILQDRKEN